MRVIEKFLLLFDDYRELRDRDQSAVEEISGLRRQVDELQSQLREAQESAIRREREITDRFFSGRVLVQDPNRATEPPKIDYAPVSVQEWKIKQAAALRGQLEERRAALLAQKGKSV